MGYLFLELLTYDVRWTPQTLQAIINVLDYPPKLDGKTLLLKIPHALVIEGGEIKLVLT